MEWYQQGDTIYIKGTKKIESDAFRHNTTIRRVVISEGCIEIGACAFEGCVGLTEVLFPDSMRYIGSYAFAGCTGLTEISLPRRLWCINGGTFRGCTGLTSVELPYNLHFIGSWSFAGCIRLTNVTITCEDFHTYIGESAFEGCIRLTRIYFPDNLKSIGDHAFFGCTSLTEVEIPAGVEIGCDAFKTEENGLSEEFQYESAVTQYDFTDDYGGVTITEYTGNREELRIPHWLDGHPVVGIGWYAFSDNSSVKTVVIPQGVEVIDPGAFENCGSLSHAVIPESVREIGYRAFADCNSLRSVQILGCVRTIGDEAFSGCSALSSVVFHEELENIEPCAFMDCTSLEQIQLPDSVEFIGDDAFSGCSALKSCNIPDGIVHMGHRVFDGCTDLVLSVTPGNFREAYPRKYQLPFVCREDVPANLSSRSHTGKLLDGLCQIVSKYANINRITGEKALQPVVVSEQRLFPWKKENGRWIAYGGLHKAVWHFDFSQEYDIWGNLEEALETVILHPDTTVRIMLPYVTLLCAGKIISDAEKYPQLNLPRTNVPVVKMISDEYYTHWFVVSDHRISILEHYMYD